MKTVLSFDIGVKNLAYCLCECHEDKIKLLEWNVISLEVPKKSGIDILSQEIITTLHEIFINPGVEIDLVLIENQPALKNPVMKTVQIILHTFFMMNLNGPYTRNEGLIGKVLCVSALSKNGIHKFISPECKTHAIHDVENLPKSYTKNKKLSILYTELLLKDSTNIHTYDGALLHMQSHKKKDDLCDAFLQLLTYYCNHGGFEIVCKKTDRAKTI